MTQGKLESFAKRLRALRQRRGLSIKEMARHVSVPETTYRDWESGTANRGEPYVKIAEALDISVYELLVGQPPVAKDEILGTMSEVEQLLMKLKFKVLSRF